jgi:polyhydroxybutyrate depolymerase
MWFYNCTPMFAVPVMEIHGTEDETLPYEGNSSAGVNGTYMPVDTVIKKWVMHDHCNGTPLTYAVADTCQTDLSSAVNYRYEGGADGSSVELFKVTGGSHSWPGGPDIFFHTNEDFSASKEIWRFFRKFKRSQFVTLVGLKQNENDLSAVRLFPNPGESLYVNAPENARVTLKTVEGKMIVYREGAGELNVSGLAPGIYFVMINYGNSTRTLKYIKE